MIPRLFEARRKVLCKVLTLIVAAALVTGCNVSGQDPNTDATDDGIPSLSSHTPDAAVTWMRAWEAQEMDVIGEQYWDDAILYPNGTYPVEGRDSIQSYLMELRSRTRLWSVQSLESESDGEIGFETGHFLTEDSTGVPVQHGSYMTVWKFSDGRWKIYRDIWNSDEQEDRSDATE